MNNLFFCAEHFDPNPDPSLSVAFGPKSKLNFGVPVFVPIVLFAFVSIWKAFFEMTPDLTAIWSDDRQINPRKCRLS